ncbi:MAG: methyl-accepting chemotaxis protein, partial [Planctomycetota bacterium]
MTATTAPGAPGSAAADRPPTAPAAEASQAAAGLRPDKGQLPPTMQWIADFSTRPIYIVVACCVVLPAVLWYALALIGGLVSGPEATAILSAGPLFIFLLLAIISSLGLLYGWLVPIEALLRGELRTPALIAESHRAVYRVPRRLFAVLLIVSLAVPAVAIASIRLTFPQQAIPIERILMLAFLALPVLALAYPLLLALLANWLDAPLGEIGTSGAERSHRVWSQLNVLPATLAVCTVVVFALVLVADLTRSLSQVAGDDKLSTGAQNASLVSQLLTTAAVRATTTTSVYVVLVFAVFLAGSRSLLRPLRELGLAARGVSHGNLYQRPLVLGARVELGDLASAYNEMLASLRHLVTYVNRVSDGDLRLRLTGDSEMSRAINRLVATQAELVRQLTETSIQLNSGAAEIFATSRQSESNSTEQASSVEETKRTMKNLLESSSRIAESAHIVYQNAEQTMDNIRLIAERLSDLVAHNQKIGEILDFVKEIADRSDLLALNASLEGTRAGEAGRGFTLVAAEMRRLAENVMDSVKDIKQLVADVRGSSQASVLATEEDMKLGAETTESAKRITFITQQQQTGTEQVSRSMDEISELLNQ